MVLGEILVLFVVKFWVRIFFFEVKFFMLKWYEVDNLVFFAFFFFGDRI